MMGKNILIDVWGRVHVQHHGLQLPMILIVYYRFCPFLLEIFVTKKTYLTVFIMIDYENIEKNGIIIEIITNR